jgi:hypothetical protein
VLTAMIVPVLIARIRAEENLLRQHFGREYEAYLQPHAVAADPGDLLIVLRWIGIWLGVCAVQSCQPNDGPQDEHRNWDRASADIPSVGIGRVV